MGTYAAARYESARAPSTIDLVTLDRTLSLVQTASLSMVYCVSNLSTGELILFTNISSAKKLNETVQEKEGEGQDRLKGRVIVYTMNLSSYP